VWLHLKLEAGAGYPELATAVAALSYLATFGKRYDATKDPLIRAILRAANPEGISLNTEAAKSREAH
jgi:hypothetical protein